MAEPLRPLPDHEVEAERERIIRSLVCPCCPARRGQACQYDAEAPDGGIGVRFSRYSHTARYDRGAARGLVPALAGVAHA